MQVRLPGGINLHFLKKLDESSLRDEFFCMLYPLPFAVFLDKVLDFALDSLKLSLGG